jgi:2,3-bisphosphoglycerate-dependent phosphoglycerate mutase
MTERYPQRAFSLPADATEVLLVRHGASAAAVPGEPFPLIEGQSDPPLAPEGERQARAVCERLAGERLAGVFVTTLCRTAQTAAPLAASTGIEPVVVPELREVHLGDWEGGEYRIRMAHGDPLIPKLFAEERWDVIPGAEAMESLARRVRAGVGEVVRAVGTGTVAAVFTHGAVIAEACRQATDSRPFAFVLVDNASITRLVVFGDGRWLLRRFNETAHLARMT